MRFSLGGERIEETALPTEKFSLLVDLGIITVPANYVHGTQLASFEVQYRNLKENGWKMFYGWNTSSNDANFPNPSRILKPGDRLLVSAYKQIVGGTTTSVERMDFCRKQPGNVWVGPQGNSLVFEQKRDQLPKNFWYTSFDEEQHCWKDSDGEHRVSCLLASSDGVFRWNLGILEKVWYDFHAFLCFRDLSKPLET